MKITYIGHSCFKIEKDGYALITDPYEPGYVPGLLPVSESAHKVLCSHEHGDHNAVSEVQMLTEDRQNCPFKIEVLPTYHDEVKGAKRGKNQIFLISDGEQRLAHLGDLGCELEIEQKEKLRGLDVLMIPIGGYYTIDGKQATDLVCELKPRIVIPMHYRDDQAGYGFDVIDTVNGFTEFVDDVVTIPGSEIDTDGELPAQVVVMQPLRAV